MHTWSFLTNTGAVLLLIAQQRPITAREIAERLALTEWPVDRITAELEAAGYLHKQCVGRAKHYEVNLALPLPHPVVCELAVGDVLPVFALAPAACHRSVAERCGAADGEAVAEARAARGPVPRGVTQTP